MKRPHLLRFALGLLVLGYLLQLFTPLRTNPDAINFLDLAASASDGRGFLADGRPSHYPPGYPIVLLALDRAGLACSAVLVGLNLLALATGLAAAAYILRRSFRLGDEAILAVMALTFLCWVFIKHVTLPLSDLPYFGAALASLAVLTWAADLDARRKPLAIGIGLLLAVVAISIRMVGIAILPALAVAVTGPPRQALVRLRSWMGDDWRRRLLVSTGILVAAVAGLRVLSGARYVHEMIQDWCGWGPLGRIKLEDWGELLLNASMAKLPRPLRLLVPLAGILAGSWVALGMAVRRRLEIVDVYVGAYLAVLLVWPYRDARFWLPVLPMLMGYAWTAYQAAGDRRAIRWGAGAYLAAYSMLGLAAIAQSSWLSLSGDRFGDRYAGGVYRASYREAYGTARPDDREATASDPRLIRLLERYRLRWTGSPLRPRDAREAGEVASDPTGRRGMSRGTQAERRRDRGGRRGLAVAQETQGAPVGDPGL